MTRARTLLLVSSSLLFAGCTLLLDFDGKSGRPCKDGACLSGYVCLDDVCVKAPENEAPDASETVTDGGTPDAGDTADAGAEGPADAGLDLTGDFTSGGASGAASGITLRGALLWNASVKGTNGRITVNGWLKK